MSLTLETKFSLGDQVYHVWGRTFHPTMPCEACVGEGQLKVVLCNDDDAWVSCPKCFGRRTQYVKEARTTYEVSKRMTIGYVRITVQVSEPTEEEYMLKETGIGSGSLYKADTLFYAKEDAERAAKIKTIDANNDEDYVS